MGAGDLDDTVAATIVTRLRNILLRLRGQLWMLPALMCVVALALALYLVRSGNDLLAATGTDFFWLYGGDAGSARELLASLLSGMITMTTLVVSITFVILTLAATQLGPRLISTFIADWQIQFVLGTFLGTILYLLVVLRTLGDTLGAQGVPHIAVSVGSALTVACMFTLLLYLNKVARAVIADNVVERVSDELRRHIRQILPERADPPIPAVAPVMPKGAASTLASGRTGYVQAIDYPALVALAQAQGLQLHVRVRAGHHVLAGGEHVAVWPAQPLDPRAVGAIRSALVIGRERTPAQDLEHGIRQLVEIGLRALSPGINDPFTAIAVVDRLGTALEEIFTLDLQPAVYRDDRGVARVFAERSDLAGVVDAAFDQLRQAGGGHPAILIRIADTLGALSPAATHPAARAALLRQLQKLEETTQGTSLTRSDRDDVRERLERNRERTRR